MTLSRAGDVVVRTSVICWWPGVRLCWDDRALLVFEGCSRAGFMRCCSARRRVRRWPQRRREGPRRQQQHVQLCLLEAFRQGSRLRGDYGQPAVFVVDGVQCVQQQLRWLRTPARPLRRVLAGRDGPPALRLQQEGVVVRDLSQCVRVGPHGNRTGVLLVPPRIGRSTRLRSQLFALGPTGGVLHPRLGQCSGMTPELRRAGGRRERRHEDLFELPHHRKLSAVSDAASVQE